MVNLDQVNLLQYLEPGKKIYFASDFHLGVPDRNKSLERERIIIRWLEHIKSDASAIFFVGDVFDFWFEYKQAIPKGFVRFQGKLAELCDQGISIFLFAGNHDLWYSDYLNKELGIVLFKKPIEISINNKRFLIGHGDGLGKGNHLYNVIKKVFTARIPQWIFRWIHPDIGITLGKFWSNASKERSKRKDEIFKGESEILFNYCLDVEKRSHHDFYVFGHRHMPLEMNLSNQSTYFNLGEWMTSNSYLKFDGEKAILLNFSV
ncbi:MAG: UDP-2,3-diacylglucosamine diphosphatase [Bacteroidota bacterium]